jgi:hypothetical protein
MSTDERISRVLTGEYPIPIYLNRHFNLSGSIRELFGPYLTWWCDAFPNVWRLRFEDIIGANGGGDVERQLRTVWGLQLALHVPGRPSDYCDRIFSRDSLTFRTGQIGGYLTDFTQNHHELFQQSAGDLLEALGYADRWKIARAFSVTLPAKYESSATVASQLRSELASHGRDFSSIAIHAAGQRNSAGLTAPFTVEANRVGDQVMEDRIHLSIDLCDSTGSTVPGLVGGNGHRYSLRVRQTSSPQTVVSAIIKALVGIGCVDRVSEEGYSRDPNAGFAGEIRALAPNSNGGPPAEDLSRAPVEALGQYRTWLQFRSTVARWLQTGQPGTYRSAQVD